jgi:RNA polymerase sigma-70 factor, ECF subfamily
MGLFTRDPLADPKPLIRAVYGYVAYRIGHGPDAEDVTSETFERALRYRDAYDPAKGSPHGWLIGIARRCIHDSRLASGAHADESVELIAADEVEEEALRRVALGAALRSLEERDLELLALRYGADLTGREMARVVGISTNAVEVALTRARARLAEALERGESLERSEQEEATTVMKRLPRR